MPHPRYHIIIFVSFLISDLFRADVTLVLQIQYYSRRFAITHLIINIIIVLNFILL